MGEEEMLVFLHPLEIPVHRISVDGGQGAFSNPLLVVPAKRAVRGWITSRC